MWPLLARDGALDAHLLDAGTGRHRGDLALQRGQLVEVGLDRGPDVQPDVVGVEPGAGAERGAGPADRLEAVGQRPLDVRQRGDLAGLVAHDDELAHLGERHEALVLGVAGGDGVQQQHVLGRLEPGELEVAQPPQVEPAADHRVHVAHRPVLLHRPVRLRAEGEVADLALVVGHDADGDPAHLGRERHPRPGWPRANAEASSWSTREVGPVHVEVDDGLVVGGAVGDQVGEQPGQLGAVGELVDRRRPC